MFKSWISHFIECLKKEFGIDLHNRHLLVLDEHNSHVTLEVVKVAMESRVDIVSLPFHTNHALQPLDVVCFKRFKTTFRKQQDSWTLGNKKKRVEKQELYEWTSKALQTILTPRNIKARFRKCGIWSLDRDATRVIMKPAAGFEQEEGKGLEKIRAVLTPPSAHLNNAFIPRHM